jgi:signal transduction histidine kinase
MLVVLAGFGIFTRTAVVRPIFELARAMERFRSGDLTVRATPTGAAELARMTQQFNAMAASLQQQHRARLTHLAGVAHDLRNPLAALQMAAALVGPDEPLPPEPGIRQALALVRRQLVRLNRMVDDLLDAARIDAGQLALEPVECDLRDAARDVAVLFQDVSAVHHLVLDLPAEPLVVLCDPLRIEQTLSNLVSNAIKYSPRGGTVWIRAHRTGADARISVTDEGVGIGESDLEQLWQPFRRTGVSGGTIPGAGLGLWAAKRIAEAHGGTIHVRSTPSKGSTFTLVLPFTVAAPTARVSHGEPSHALGIRAPSPGGSHG